VFAILDAAGLWPEEPGFRRALSEREEYQRDLTWARMVVVASAFVAAIAAFRISRSPFALAAVLVSLTALFVDASIQVESNRVRFEWETVQLMVIAFMGAAALAGGVLVPRSDEHDYALWLYVMGLVGLAIGLGGEAFPSEDLGGVGWGILWLIVALGVVALSVPLQQRLFAAAGLAGVFAYLAKLVFDVFESANVALALVVLGLLILATGALYQRYSERLYKRGGET
jgi:hypothetical protein